MLRWNEFMDVKYNLCLQEILHRKWSMFTMEFEIFNSMSLRKRLSIN